GSFALLGLLIWFAARFLRFGAVSLSVVFGPGSARVGKRVGQIHWQLPTRWAPPLFRLSVIGAVVGYVVALCLFFLNQFVLSSDSGEGTDLPLTRYTGWVLTFAAGC